MGERSATSLPLCSTLCVSPIVNFHIPSLLASECSDGPEKWGSDSGVMSLRYVFVKESWPYCTIRRNLTAPVRYVEAFTHVSL